MQQKNGQIALSGQIRELEADYMKKMAEAEKLLDASKKY
jgi:hypothetical protein